MDKRRPLFHLNFQGNLLAGLLTVTPLIAVWLVFDFVLNVLSGFGRPLADRLTPYLDRAFPGIAPLLASPVARWLVAVAVALTVLYLIGAIASRVIGQRLIALFEIVITRIPLVETIYSAVKKLVEMLQQRPGSDQRVALLDWPHEGLKTVGFVMRSFADAKTGEEMAAVYVPSALNPTSGFLQVLPMSKLMLLDIPTDQAMTMIISGGAIVPEKMSVAQPD
ncbi:MAG TPA: DUF502 domain-containing protein [Rhizomicrobium sp.]|nr:DUF502 domain-containing protein [Rhizomicrobium sp.]